MTDRHPTPGASFDPVLVGRLFVPVAVVACWAGLSGWLGQALLPGPVRTAGVVGRGVAAGWVVGNLRDTLATVAAGFVLAAVSGLVVGLVLGLREVAADVFEVYVLSAYAVPKVVLFPLFLFVFGLGTDTKVAFGAFHGFFPMAIVTMGAVREVDDVYLAVARSLGLSRWQLFRYVLVPFVLVQLVVALRLAFSLTFLGVVLAELFAAKSGLGLVLGRAMANFDTDRLMAVVAVLMVVAVLGNVAFYAAQGVLERRWNLNADVEGL